MEEDGSVYQIQTFVFFDLETTGCHNDSHILELSMIAISRKDLLSMKENRPSHNSKEDSVSSNSPRKYGPPLPPRVVHKYTRLYYPKKIIYPLVEEITGLNNDLLHHLSCFGNESALAIKQFLDLPPPVCIIAHNGRGFDFPILKSELLNVSADAANNLRGILCADSLTFARHHESEDIKLLTELAKDFKDSDFEDSDNLCAEPPSKRQNCNSSSSLANMISTNSNMVESSLPSTSRNIFKTPEKFIFHKLPNKFPQTPHKNSSTTLHNGVYTPEQSPKGEINAETEKPNVRRTLYYNKNYGENAMKKPFSQETLYYRLFRSTYNAHNAESDALALMQICAFHGQDFITWADNNSFPFQSVKPRWTTRKSFVI